MSPGAKRGFFGAFFEKKLKIFCEEKCKKYLKNYKKRGRKYIKRLLYIFSEHGTLSPGLLARSGHHLAIGQTRKAAAGLLV